MKIVGLLGVKLNKKWLSPSFLSSWLSLVASLMCLYWWLKFHELYISRMSGLKKFNTSIENIKCLLVDKNIAIEIAKKSVDASLDMENMCLAAAFALFVIFIIGFASTSSNLNKIYKLQT